MECLSDIIPTNTVPLRIILCWHFPKRPRRFFRVGFVIGVPIPESLIPIAMRTRFMRQLLAQLPNRTRTLFRGDSGFFCGGFAGFPRRTRPWLPDQGQTQGARVVIGNAKMAKSERASRLGRVLSFPTNVKLGARQENSWPYAGRKRRNSKGWPPSLR